MKKLLMVLLCIAPTLSTAKELPPVDEMINRLDQSGLTAVDNWVKVGDGFQQNINSGILFVMPSSVSSIMAVAGEGDELLNSFAYAGIHCAKSSVIAIDMAHNENLINNMVTTFSDSLKTYQNKNNTLIWGYNFETELINTDKGIIINCTLK